MKRLFLVVLFLAACRCATTGVDNSALQNAVSRNVVVVLYDKAGTILGYCSGVAIDSETVLTAGHCQAEKVTVDSLPAQVIAKSPSADLLLIRAHTVNIEPVIVRDAEYTESVFCVANHAPWANLFGAGYVTRVDDNDVDATVMAVPGFSGSGLWGRDGKLLGIFSQIVGCDGEHGPIEMFGRFVSAKQIKPFIQKYGRPDA